MLEVYDDDLVLVAIRKSMRDLQIARLLGWYRIPVQTAPKTINVDLLGFYQTAAFGEQKWSVRYAARVRGYELTTRLELLQGEPDHPRADEPYFRLQIGPLQALPQPIESGKWLRFTFLYTTGERLLAARELKELRVSDSQTRDRLWRLLHERGVSFAGSPTEPTGGEAG